MGQQLRALAALPEKLGSSPTIHMAAYNYLQLQFKGIRYRHTNAHKIKLNLINK